MAGEIAYFSSFSFHAVKNFTTAEGGALTWNLPFGSDVVNLDLNVNGERKTQNNNYKMKLSDDGNMYPEIKKNVKK